MLVLSRRPHESIRIGDAIVVTVLEVHGDHVRIGIDAPRDVEVHRQEVYETILAANTQAASPSTEAVAALDQLHQILPARRPPAESRGGDTGHET